MVPPAEVGHSVWQWRNEPLASGPVVIFDVDGVLSDANGRQHFLEGERKDWSAFFEACGDDPVVAEVARLTELLDPALGVVLVTGRPARVQPQTLAWLERYDLRWDLLVMRDRQDHRKADLYKRAVVGELRAEGYDPRLAFEDDRRNVAAFHAEGVPCVYLHSGYYDE